MAAREWLKPGEKRRRRRGYCVTGDAKPQAVAAQRREGLRVRTRIQAGLGVK